MLMHNLTIPSDELVLDDQTTHIQHIPSTPEKPTEKQTIEDEDIPSINAPVEDEDNTNIAHVIADNKNVSLKEKPKGLEVCCEHAVIKCKFWSNHLREQCTEWKSMIPNKDARILIPNK